MAIRKDILILGNHPSDGLDGTKLTVEKEYSINFNEEQNKFILAYTIIEATVILME